MEDPTVPYEQFSCLPPAGSQERFDAAVIIPTILRPTLVRAVQSVFNQDLRGRIQLLIGIDQRQGDSGCLETAVRECPGNVFLSVFDPGYSTSVRHGGIYSNRFSGALRTILSYAANSKYVAYLDDDDWWGRGHLSGLLSAIEGKDWAFSFRWLVDRETGWPICQDEWDSLGPGQGINRERFGGFVSPSNLLLDKEACHFVMPYWSLSPFQRRYRRRPSGLSGVAAAPQLGRRRQIFLLLRNAARCAKPCPSCPRIRGPENRLD